MFLKEKYKSKLKLLSSAFIFLLFLLLPKITDGFVFDLGHKQLEGLSEAVGPILALAIFLFLFLILSFGLLKMATEYLVSIITATPEVLTLDHRIIEVGWEFVLGISNMLLIIAFVIIAISIILKFDNLGLKKAFPRLIGVALLINFSLVFVGMGIDVSNVFFSTISEQLVIEPDCTHIEFYPGEGVCPSGTVPGDPQFCEGEEPCCCERDGPQEATNLVTASMDTLFTGTTEQIIGFAVALGVFSLAMLIPYLSVAVQFAVIAAGFIWFGEILSMFVQGLINMLLAGAFFLFFVIFVVRIFIIQILAVIAPLAFICLIFPGTKIYGYFELWLRSLLQWLFAGIVFAFLLILGFNMVGMVDVLEGSIREAELGETGWVVGISRIFLDSGIVYYVILLIYFITILFFGKKFIPAGVDAAISQAKTFGASISGTAGRAFKHSFVPKGSQERANVPEGVENMAERMRKMPIAKLAAPSLARWAKRRKSEAEEEAKKTPSEFQRPDQIRRAGGKAGDLKKIADTGDKYQENAARLAIGDEIEKLQRKRREVEASQENITRGAVQGDFPQNTGESNADYNDRIQREMNRRQRSQANALRNVNNQISQYKKIAPHAEEQPTWEDVARETPKRQGQSEEERNRIIQTELERRLDDRYRDDVNLVLNMSPGEQRNMIPSAYRNEAVADALTQNSRSIQAVAEYNYKGLRNLIETFNDFPEEARRQRRHNFNIITAHPAYIEAEELRDD